MWFLIFAVAFLAFVLTMFAVGALAFTTSLGGVDLAAIGIMAFAVVNLGMAVYLSAKKTQNEPRRAGNSDTGSPAGELKNASASPSDRQAAGEKSAWS